MIHKIVGIDIGWANLAMVVCRVENGGDDIRVIHSENFDLRETLCEDNDCIFDREDRKGAHMVTHYIKRVRKHLVGTHKVLIEAQPIMSTHKDVEQLLFLFMKQMGLDVSLVSPRSMHAHFEMSDSKVARRVQVVDITKEYLQDQDSFKNAEEKDHLGDALAFVLHYVESNVLRPKNYINPFNKFRYIT